MISEQIARSFTGEGKLKVLAVRARAASCALDPRHLERRRGKWNYLTILSRRCFPSLPLFAPATMPKPIIRS